MNNDIALIIGTFAFIYFFDFTVKRIKKKLSGWNYMEKFFRTKSEPDKKSLYGIHAAFFHSQSKYPLADTFAKIKITAEGLYFQFQLFFEIPKVYKPVFIPWKNIKYEIMIKDNKLGFDRYHVYYQDHEIGMICVQPFVSKEMHEEMKKLNIHLDVVRF